MVVESVDGCVDCRRRKVALCVEVGCGGVMGVLGVVTNEWCGGELECVE